MSMGLKANADGSGAIQVGGSDAIVIGTNLSLNMALPIQSLSASVAASALTISTGLLLLSFRSATLTSGATTTASGTPTSLVVPSTATLATVNAQQSRLIVLALNNAGTLELAVTNLVGGANLDETTLINTTAIAQTCTFTGAIAVTTGILTLSATGTGTFALGQALSGTGVPSGTFVRALLTGSLGAAGSTYSTNITTAVASTTLTGFAGAGIYSTTARTSVPFRVIGYIESTQATAGTWATAPSTIQGAGGNALTSMQSLGFGQTYQDVTASRALATTYYNTTGKPITVVIAASNNVANGYYTGTVNGSVVITSNQISTANYYLSPLSFIVPPSGSYSAQTVANITTIIRWTELR